MISKNNKNEIKINKKISNNKQKNEQKRNKKYLKK